MHPLSGKSYTLIYHVTKQHHSFKYEKYEMTQLLWSAQGKFYKINSKAPLIFWMIYDNEIESTPEIFSFVHLKNISIREIMNRYL